MESQPQNPEFRNNPENRHESRKFCQGCVQKFRFLFALVIIFYSGLSSAYR